MEIKHEIIKIAGEEAVSKTIEELLQINDLFGKRSDSFVCEIQENQLANTDNRREETRLTEKQFDEKREFGVKHKLDMHRDNDGITEIRLNDKENKQRRPEAFEDQNVNGHKFTGPLWGQIHKQEKETKKLDKGQLDKKRK